MPLDIINQGTIGAPLVETAVQVYYVEYLCLILYSHLSWKHIMHVARVGCIRLHLNIIILLTFTPFTWCVLAGTYKTSSGDPSCQVLFTM